MFYVRYPLVSLENGWFLVSKVLLFSNNVDLVIFYFDRHALFFILKIPMRPRNVELSKVVWRLLDVLEAGKDIQMLLTDQNL